MIIPPSDKRTRVEISPGEEEARKTKNKGRGRGGRPHEPVCAR